MKLKLFVLLVALLASTASQTVQAQWLDVYYSSAANGNKITPVEIPGVGTRVPLAKGVTYNVTGLISTTNAPLSAPFFLDELSGDLIADAPSLNPGPNVYTVSGTSSPSVAATLSTVTPSELMTSDILCFVPNDLFGLSARVLKPGDTDCDGVVTLSDFSILAANYGNAGTWKEGDFNGDGIVGFADFLLLQDNL